MTWTEGDLPAATTGSAKRRNCILKKEGKHNELDLCGLTVAELMAIGAASGVAVGGATSGTWQGALTGGALGAAGEPPAVRSVVWVARRRVYRRGRRGHGGGLAAARWEPD